MVRYIQIKLLEARYWGLPDIEVFLHGRDVSPIIDLKTLDSRLYDIIKRSNIARQIELLDLEGNSIYLVTQQIDDSICDIDDIEEEDTSEESFDIISVTISDKKETKEELEPDLEHYEKAEIILSRNGNTAKKIIKSTECDIRLMMALKEIEKQNKNRKSILKEIANKMGESNA